MPSLCFVFTLNCTLAATKMPDRAQLSFPSYWLASSIVISYQEMFKLTLPYMQRSLETNSVSMLKVFRYKTLLYHTKYSKLLGITMSLHS
jgi:hypothetical protein